MSDSIGCNQTPRAQQTLPTGAGTARGDSAGAEAGVGGAAEVRWVGAQHLMHGYCGREVVTGKAQVPAAGANRGARVDVVRPVALLDRRRQRVVRIGPRPAGAAGLGGAAASDAGCEGEAESVGETRARAA